ncbi:MAG TPA: bifunctional 5,10-methylene-tetrahydrofolate dehydrogenase/5,10-methylene-tetrahydrofolate cyclohydrolase [Flavobacteriales bacterium]|nr:bifunctional 5,10-methylene-tetrahydrofolate dehydrogenase/5,10-methylene-tetrahydrofolate cyclohydrolase [Flavobacteriales bacterium]|tara:strand:+ start:5060 stop:5941 length:882 start_codon:yes stop_codon:yes gene_type:complete
MSIRIDGKATAAKVRAEIKEKVDQLKLDGFKTPHLAAVLVGSDGGSKSYVGGKMKACEEVGFKSSLIEKAETTTEEELLQIVHDLNQDSDVDGYIVQLPLPKHISEQKVLEAISPDKDVDGFHPLNMGKMVAGLDCFKPATPFGILELLRRYEIETSGKHCVVIGRSHIVGTPLSIMLSRNSYPGNCTVTLTHSRTKDLSKLTQMADILIVALGKPGFVTDDMVKPGAVIIDVGTTRVEDASRERGWRLSGDVDYKNVKEIASYITPVPGGVGPMTIASLMTNTLQAAKGKRP